MAYNDHCAATEAQLAESQPEPPGSAPPADIQPGGLVCTSPETPICGVSHASRLRCPDQTKSMQLSSVNLSQNRLLDRCSIGLIVGHTCPSTVGYQCWASGRRGALKIRDEQKPECLNEWDLFYGAPDDEGNDDGRAEVGREEREAMASILCAGCPYVLKCLEEALVTRQEYGVWGAMGEGERRKFRTHLMEEGYRRYEIPTGRELYASVKAFYRYMETPAEKIEQQTKQSA